ncbi:polysaccharide biosynthesis tyrosine autokinase [Halomonas kalidii]|uniref:Polysaccharide biosynthesis tyrosine autokinase n=1 Tax=Halomonas kalidii TaxID=3043293 RepID=A0ABT6VLE7_9GAMM|nr:polysaccharide biosynthesis tyrosine autokinase [Halomonas kalidii]MDI5934369.1 polysaccharide biosynthesis tyrosine autokinase [Halomonas kalidii]
MTVLSSHSGGGDPPRDTPDISLVKLISMLMDHKWTIMLTVVVFMLAGYFYASSQPRIYQSDTLIQIESRGSTLGLLETLAVGEQGSNSTTAELEILRSRMVMGETVDRLDLAIQIEPVRLPLVGDFLVNHGFTHEQMDGLKLGWLVEWLASDDQAGNDLGSPYVWAGESLRVSRFDVPAHREGASHVVRVLDDQHFELLLDGEQVLTGRVEETIQDEATGYRLFISQLDAHAGATFRLRRVSHLDAIALLQGRFSTLPMGKESGVYQALLNGTDPERIVHVLDTITGVFLSQNVQRQSEEAEKQIAFLDEQIPQVNVQLTDAENSLNEYRAQRDSVDLTFETENLLRSLVAVDNQLSELALAEADLAERFRPTHPNYQALLRKRAQLAEEKARLEAEVNNLPETQQEVLRLTRDTQVNQQIYVQLLNQRQEMRLVKAGTVGNVRILDPAVLQKGTIAPRIGLLTLGSGLLGALLAIVGVILKLAFNRAIETPDQLEALGLPVYAIVPVSVGQGKLSQLLRRRKKDGVNIFRGLLAQTHPEEPSVEALRGLRTSLHFAMLEASDNRLVITGSSPGAGKSFVAANLAAVYAQAGQRVLLVDADMRKGYLHHAFQQHGDKGLSELLATRIELEEAIRPSGIEGLDFIARGTVPPNPSELLMQHSFEDFLQRTSQLYDLVILDTPPVMAVTDAVIVGKQAGSCLMVVRYGLNPPREIEVAKRRLEHAGVRVRGAVLNATEYSSGSSYSYYNVYAYR